MKFILCFIWSSVLAFAATFNSNGTPSDVQAKLNLCGAGDTVTMPAGTFNWTSAVAVTVPANVTLIGAGNSSTGGGDQTIIVDQFNSGSVLLDINVASTGVFRMSGFTIRTDDQDPLKDNGIIRINGPGQVRIDHMHFDCHTNPAGNSKPLWIGNLVYGVAYQNIMDLVGSSSIYVANGAGADGQGNQVWVEPTGFGGPNFITFEDNLYRAASAFPDLPFRIADTFSAGRVLWRFNTIQGGSGLEVHATGHSGDDRGARAAEGYGNNFIVMPGQTTPPFDMADISSGPMLVWGNAAEPETLKNIFFFNVTRKNNDTYSQAATPAGWGYAGTAFNGTGSNWDGGTFNGTDTVLGYPAIDQPGRGASPSNQILTGSFPSKVNSLTGTIQWPAQALEPVYIWKNTGLTPHSGYGGSVYANNSGGRVVSNRDYYPQASGIQTSPSSPFDGTVGVGWGTLANRPATCTTGVAYWATDQGSWNHSTSNPYGVQQNGADGVLYVATSTNTWALYYEPYTYPHPIRNETQVAAPIFSPVAGTFITPQNVTITSVTDGATIRYTTNGVDPSSTTGTIYSTPVAISVNTTLKAIAYDGVLLDSNVTTGSYLFIGAGDGNVIGTTTVTTQITLP